ncbi:MAG: hypothetical protein VB858_06485 [Planctomycetaceae bacterium]
MGKLGYAFTTLIGAIPAGIGLAVLIMDVFLKRTEVLSNMMLTVCIVIAVCMALVALTPFMVLVFYRDTRPKLAAAGAAAAAGVAVAAGSSSDEGFGDAIPEDFNEDEVRDSAEDEEYDDFEDGDFEEGDYDDDFEDLDF